MKFTPEKMFRLFNRRIEGAWLRSAAISLIVLSIVTSIIYVISPPSVQGVSSNIVISQVYGGGGNSGATYKNDFIELFNRGTTSINVTGWSVQYASTAGTTWQVTFLSGTIAPGQYYLVQEAQGSGGTTSLPTPDATGTIPMSATNGKVALVNSTVALSGSCPLGASVIDFVGFGTANCYEGAAATPGLTNTTGALRGAGGCTDTDDNSSDFATGSPNPRNSASPLNGCGGPTNPAGTGTANPNSVILGNMTLLTVSVTPGGNPTSTGITVSGDLSSIGGSAAQSFFDDGTNGDMTAGDNIFSFQATVSGMTVPGMKTLPITINDAQSRTGNTSIALTVQIDPNVITFIHSIQGTGETPNLVGLTVNIEGIVVGDYPGIGGFFVEEEDTDWDADPNTSEGIFIYDPDLTPDVAVGDKVKITGTVANFPVSPGVTELTVTTINILSSGNTLPTTVTIPLPIASTPDAAFEKVEGMLVKFTQTLYVTDTFDLGRYGEIPLSINNRLSIPTNVVLPGAPANALQALNDRSRILLDDISNAQNIDPTLYPTGGLSAANPLRTGDTLSGLTGVIDFLAGEYRIRPVGTVNFIASNPRPATPPVVGGTLKIVGLNVLNYFNGDGMGGGFPTSRGASTLAEFTRQRDKIINALIALNADIVGLTEIENDAPGNSAIEDLVGGLNAVAGAGTYAFINTGIIGTDQIRVALIYKPASVTPSGAFAILDSTVNPIFLDTLNRPSLAQTFTRNSNGASLTVAINHLKSKGSNCNSVGDPDVGDGQDNCNITRTNAAVALTNWLATDPTGSGDPDFLIIGDLNSYAMEDPITAIKNGGFTDLINSFNGTGAYSFVFSGQSGYLDHALASSSLLSQVTGANQWHINADEPTVLDYNVEFKTANHVNSFYDPGPFRASDHDPVLIGLDLDATPTIGAVPATQQQGSPSVNKTIANVGDPDQAVNTLSIKVNGGATATVNGVTVSNISVSAGGAVTADVVATCTATNAAFTLRVTDNTGSYTESTLNVTVTANTVPVLSYANQNVIAGNGLTINPATGPSDNGSITSIIVKDQGTFTGGISVNAAGVVTITNAALLGNHTITIRATDNCGAVTDATFILAVSGLTAGIADPAVCNGPGGVVDVTATVTNGSDSSQTASFTATLPPELPALPGTCTANVGTCSVVNTTTVNWSGTLAGGQTVTIKYKAQIGDQVITGTTLCVTSSAVVGGSPAGNVQACATANCPGLGPGLPIPTSNSVASDQKPGSVLIYNIYTSSTNANLENTRINLTNIEPSKNAYVHLFFVDGASCSVADMFVCLTPNQTTSFLTSDFDPGTSGYIVAVAVDENGCPANFNFLIGDEYVKFASGHSANLSAVSVAAIAGGLPLCGLQSESATLPFDGVSYDVLPQVLALDNIPSRVDGNDTMVILNRIGGNLATGPSRLNPIFGLLYDDAENGLSFTLNSGTCQYRTIISNSSPRTVPRFEQFIPSGRSGWLKLWQTGGAFAMTGSMINFNANAAAAGNAFNQGHNLHVLTTTSSMSYSIPVFPAGC